VPDVSAESGGEGAVKGIADEPATLPPDSRSGDAWCAGGFATVTGRSPLEQPSKASTVSTAKPNGECGQVEDMLRWDMASSPRTKWLKQATEQDRYRVRIPISFVLFQVSAGASVECAFSCAATDTAGARRPRA
jgi:hypothetical protein